VAAFAFLALLVFWVVTAVLWTLDRVNSSAEHRCMIAIVQRNAQSRSLLGTPIAQKGFTSASFGQNNSDYRMDMSFAVAGSRQGGAAYARGHRSPFESSFQVVLETDDGHRVRLYDGPYKCPVKI
jgi:cytochrome oxidase complex assembly protein 1